MDRERRIIIGISGGIAAYKVPSLVRLLRKSGAQIKTVLTSNARGLVGEEALRTVSGNPVYTDQFQQYDMDHIRLSEWADTFLVCPATANTIAKIAHGVADNLLTSLALSIPEDRIIIAPAMNTIMWLNSATQHNVSLLNERGITVLPVGEGALACDRTGPGRMLEIDEIAEYVSGRETGTQILKGKKILISSGPTEEPIDPVRVITNKSSGKMGAALARAALVMGAQVTVVAGPQQEPLPVRATIIKVRTAQQMHAALLEQFPSFDICIMAAAISDFRPSAISSSKIPRENGEQILHLVSNPDITASLNAIKKTQILIGFSLETENDIERARAKMQRKGCDMMIFNRADTSLGGDCTEITIIDKNGSIEPCGMMDKSTAAYHILKRTVSHPGPSHE